MDIGPQTLTTFTDAIQEAKTVLWNGPLGVFEFENFSQGTFGLAQALSTLSDCITIIGGGDSVAAVHKAHLADKMSHISTGGGASLEYVEHGSLCGIDALV